MTSIEKEIQEILKKASLLANIEAMGTEVIQIEIEANSEKVYAVMMDNARDFVPYEDNWSISYHHGSSELILMSSKVFQGDEIYFDSKEMAETIIDFLGEDNIKKYYLGVL